MYETPVALWEKDKNMANYNVIVMLPPAMPTVFLELKSESFQRGNVMLLMPLSSLYLT